MPDPDSWTGFTATLQEKRARPFTGFNPVETERPRCPETALIDGTLRYEFDGSNLFLLDTVGGPKHSEPSRRVDESTVPWIRSVRTDPVRTPLGWSKYIGRPLFWLHENLVFPGEIASWVLWRQVDATAHVMPFSVPERVYGRNESGRLARGGRAVPAGDRPEAARVLKQHMARTSRAGAGHGPAER